MNVTKILAFLAKMIEEEGRAALGALFCLGQGIMLQHWDFWALWQS